jgi:eukaryotic-like serine/threonine-protein kinase
LIVFILLLVLTLIFLLIRSCDKSNVNNSSNDSSNASSLTDNSQDSSPGDESELNNSEEIPDVGDLILFGEYQQDANAAAEKEPIQWRVLDVKEDMALLLSVKNLDCVLYNEIHQDVTWETCDVRNWLNSNFIAAAFTATETARIIETDVVTLDNPVHGTSGGNDTVDRIFLLSVEEVLQYLPDDDRLSLNTDYARLKGAYDNGGYGNWWLRSPGAQNRAVRTVSCFEGYISDSGTGVEQDINTVRPAMWVRFGASN